MRAVRGYICWAFLGAAIYACSPRVSVGDLGETLDGAAGGSATGGAGGEIDFQSDATANPQACVLNSDCQAPQICAQSRCHEQMCDIARLPDTAKLRGDQRRQRLHARGVGQGRCRRSRRRRGSLPRRIRKARRRGRRSHATPTGRICPDNLPTYLPPKSVDCTGLVVPLGHDPCTIPRERDLRLARPTQRRVLGVWLLRGARRQGVVLHRCRGAGHFRLDHLPARAARSWLCLHRTHRRDLLLPRAILQLRTGRRCWSCTPNPKPASPPREIADPPPSNVDESKQIKDLSDAEAAAWCSWYADPGNNPRPSVNNIDPPGITNYGYHGLSLAR